MKMWKIFLAVLISVILIFVIVGFSLDSKFTVSRSRLIPLSQKQIWRSVEDLRQWPEWSPWMEADSTMKYTFSDPSSGVGATMSWVSETSGEGSQILTYVEEGRRFETELHFGKKNKAHSQWLLEAKGDQGEKTLVTWSFGGEMGYDLIGRYMALLMDRFMGPFFEKGLENLEKAALRLPAVSTESSITTDSLKVDSLASDSVAENVK